MTGWTGGYITDIAYTEHYHRDLAPALLGFACLLARRRGPDLARPLAILDLGCGNGLNAIVAAAAAPGSDVHGVDFMPAHIAKARWLADLGDVSNVTFHEADFADFARTPGLPAFDIITLHGVWTWVGPEVRRSVLDLLARHLKPGGLFYVSYNALPGWSAAAPLQHLLKAATDAAPAGASTERVETGFAFIDRLMEVDPKFARNNPSFQSRWKLSKRQDRRYVVHEFLNACWQPLHFADVAASMTEVKLQYVGTSRVIDTVDAAHLTPEQRTYLGSVPDGWLRETARDYILNQHFRTDIYIKGATPLFASEVDREWDGLRFVLAIDRTQAPDHFNGHLGRINLPPNIYGPLMDALAQGPIGLGDLAARPALSHLERASLCQALTVLVGIGAAEVCLPDADLSARSQTVERFNHALLDRAEIASDLPWLVSPFTGGAINIDRFSMLYHLADRRNREPADVLWPILERENQRLLFDGRRLETAEENRAEIARRFAEFRAGNALRLARLGIGG